MDVDRLAAQVSGRGPAWYAATARGTGDEVDGYDVADGGRDRRPRREVLRALVIDLAALGGTAGTGQPPDAVPPDLGDHALADQLVVLGREVIAAPVDVSAAVDRLVAAARALL